MTRATAAKEVVRILRDRILSGEIDEGTALRQEKIATELGVSRIPVREALKHLEVEGLVKIVSHSGAVVAELSLDEIRQTFELRAVVETWLLAAAIPFMTQQDLAEAEAIVTAMDEAGIESWGDMNWRFHERLYRPANRDHITAMIRRIHEGTDRYIYMHMKVTDGKEKAQSDHRQILSLCREKDLHRAVAFLQDHILDVADKLIGSVEAARETAKNRRPRRRR
ncbi:GntR family transcriptional regulator [Phreatobacter sp. AB_2022a]|uniref:GntR family transcriptional regulator n=1 Tax=Phreatobacter sp. AB_2022a TaxID=3003134 RepID=UPI002286F0DC|nr:GntR family transcriptional regulator [Phreatobacter sp. AB_2022a]MCZ0737994.1 GntR family transcriptional regulator [Phreatobacter sp. AB_2022a]